MWRRWLRSIRRLANLKQFDRFERPSQNRFVLRAKPVLENCCIDAAKIRVVLQVTIVQIGHARKLANQSRVDSVAGKEYGPSRSVIRPIACVLSHAASKFTEAHHQDTVPVALAI